MIIRRMCRLMVACCIRLAMLYTLVRMATRTLYRVFALRMILSGASLRLGRIRVLVRRSLRGTIPLVVICRRSVWLLLMVLLRCATLMCRCTRQ